MTDDNRPYAVVGRRAYAPPPPRTPPFGCGLAPSQGGKGMASDPIFTPLRKGGSGGVFLGRGLRNPSENRPERSRRVRGHGRRQPCRAAHRQATPRGRAGAGRPAYPQHWRRRGEYGRQPDEAGSACLDLCPGWRRHPGPVRHRDPCLSRGGREGAESRLAAGDQPDLDPQRPGRGSPVHPLRRGKS